MSGILVKTRVVYIPRKEMDHVSEEADESRQAVDATG